MNAIVTPITPTREEGDFIEIVGNLPPLIPEGEYVATYLHYETKRVFNTSKLFAHFELVEPGPHTGTCLYRAYRVPELLGRQKTNGGFQLGRRSDLYLELLHLFGERGMRPDRVSMSWLRNKLLRVKVRTVTRDHRHRPLPVCLHYSVVDSLVAIEAGNDQISS